MKTKTKLNGFYLNEVYYKIESKEKGKGYLSMHIPTWNNEIESLLKTFFVGDFSQIRVTPYKNDGYTLTSRNNFKNNLLDGIQLYQYIEGIFWGIYKKQYSIGSENKIQSPPSKIVSIEIINEDLTIA